MMDDLIQKVEDVAGIDLPNNAADAMEMVTDKVSDLTGISEEIIAEVKTKATELLADGKLSKDEVVAEVKKFAAEKGVPEGILNTIDNLI